MFAALCVKALMAQCAHSTAGNHHTCPGLEPIFEDAFTFIPPPADFFSGERSSTFIVNYSGFSPESQAAFQYAVDIWASLLTSSVPIVINANYQSVAGSSLGFASANQLFDNFPNAPQPNTAYPVALANKFAGFDLNPNSHDISATFNSNFVWYFGTDGNCPSGQYDFVTVVLHELGHGLGIAGSPVVSNGLGNWQLPVRVVYDKLIENGTGQNITTFPPNTAELAAQLTGNDLFWFGSAATAANNDVKPKIHAPATWSGGSSFSHLHEASYIVGDVNSLMTPFVQQAEANHSPGPIAIGMMKDMGWTLKSENVCTGEEWVMALETDCNPEETFWQLFNDQGMPLVTVGADTYQEAGMQLVTLCLEPGECYTLVLQDGGGNGLTGCSEPGSFAIYNPMGETIAMLDLLDFGTEVSFDFCVSGVEGCTDSEAINFNPDAQINDGSCFYDCELPQVTYTVVCEGENPTTFMLEVSVGELGIAAPYELSIPEASSSTTLIEGGDFEYGPFQIGMTVNIGLSSEPYSACVSTTTVPGICPVDIEETEQETPAFLPNPFRDVFTVTLQTDAFLTVYDIRGRQVYSEKLKIGVNTIDLRYCEAGIYLASVRTESLVNTVVLMKSNNH